MFNRHLPVTVPAVMSDHPRNLPFVRNNVSSPLGRAKILPMWHCKATRQAQKTAKDRHLCALAVARAVHPAPGPSLSLFIPEAANHTRCCRAVCWDEN